MSVEIVNARSEPTIGGPPPYLSQSKRYSKNADTVAKQNAFLAAYAKHGTITHSAREAGIAPAYHYKWLDIDPDYPSLFKAAHQEAVEALEREARRRAIEGVEEPTGWYKGEPGGFVKKYSDTLLIFLLKGALPDKYKDRHEHTGKDGGPIEVQATVSIEQLPTWLKQAIVVLSSGVQLEPEFERQLQQVFEARFLECEKLIGSGQTQAASVASDQVSSQPVERFIEVAAESAESEKSDEPETLETFLESGQASGPALEPDRKDFEPHTTPTARKDYRSRPRGAELDIDEI